jgi:hypothetical protein
LYKQSARDTFEAFHAERERIARYRNQGNIPIMIVGYQDSGEKAVSTEEGTKLAKAFNCSFTEYVPKSGKVDQIFIHMIKSVQDFEIGNWTKKMTMQRTGSMASAMTELEIVSIVQHQDSIGDCMLCSRRSSGY